MATPSPIPADQPRLAPREGPHSMPRDSVLGVPLALTDYERTLDWIDEAVAARTPGYVCVAAVHTVMACGEDPELRAAARRAPLPLPGRQPLVWALNLLGHRLSSRVYGPDLMWKACERAARTGTRFYLYGGRNQGALVQLALNLRTAFPGLRIVGGYSPPFRALEPDEEARVLEEIDASGADVVWVGIGVPKQEKWMARVRPRLRGAVLVGVGAAFDFHAGLISQAPAWMQRLGLEWAFRLSREPRRLWRRYVRYNPRFVASFARQYGRPLPR